MSRSLVIVAVLLTGCDQVLGLDRKEPDCGAAVTVLDLDFEDDVEPCEPWGYRFDDDGTTVLQRDGVLQVTPRGTGAAGCVSKAMYRFPRAGLICDIKEVVSTDGAYTSMNAGNDDSIQKINNELLYETSDGRTKYTRIPFVATTMRWWKLHEAGGMRIASYSADGLGDWSVLGELPSPGPQNVQVGVLAGLYMAMPDATGAARYGRLLVCV